MRGQYAHPANKRMMKIGCNVDYVRSGGMRNVPVTKAVEHLYATTAKFSGAYSCPHVLRTLTRHGGHCPLPLYSLRASALLNFTDSQKMHDFAAHLSGAFVVKTTKLLEGARSTVTTLLMSGYSKGQKMTSSEHTS
ncbi:hypothetical protein AVEN_136046-1 [Araneus ventricosus]|uniref:Uncharacterized protein n=1 Tax=Araneus ventricosus TaxID=182803 RepID=A0A4Y2ETD0_ARAVE|nr:hypothetical protein AVEN_136046-1 [Araneus ventricosus]